MKISGYIIEKYNKMDGAYTCHRLVDEAKALNIHLEIIGVNDCCITENGIINKEYPLLHKDFVINHYKWGKIKDELNFLAHKSYNNINAFNSYVNKYEQVKSLHSEEFFIPKYILATSLFQYNDLISKLNTPFIAKGLEHSMGREIFLIKNESDYYLLRKNFAIDKEWLFEEFISTSYGRDLRLYCIRGEAIACILRKSKNDFRANIALGATADAVDIDASLQKIADDIYKQTNLDFVGIDLLFGKNKYYLCEINVMPGLKGVEKTTGINIANKMLSLIKKDFDNE